MPGVDYRTVRAMIRISEVLELLNWTPRQRYKNTRRGGCPIHNSESRTSLTFSVHLERGVFQCFKCGAKGNALDLYALAKDLPLYDAAVEMCERTARSVPWIAASRVPVAPPAPSPRTEQEEEPVHKRPKPDGLRVIRLP